MFELPSDRVREPSSQDKPGRRKAMPLHAAGVLAPRASPPARRGPSARMSAGRRGRGRRRRSCRRLVRRRRRRPAPSQGVDRVAVRRTAWRARRPSGPTTTSPSSPMSCSGAAAGPAGRASRPATPSWSSGRRILFVLLAWRLASPWALARLLRAGGEPCRHLGDRHRAHADSVRRSCT